MKPFSIQATIWDDDNEEEVTEMETVATFDTVTEASEFLDQLMDVAREQGFLEKK